MVRNGANRCELAKGLGAEANKGLERAARRNSSRAPVPFETYATGDGALSGSEGIARSVHRYGPILVGAGAEVEPWR